MVVVYLVNFGNASLTAEKYASKLKMMDELYQKLHCTIKLGYKNSSESVDLCSKLIIRDQKNVKAECSLLLSFTLFHFIYGLYDIESVLPIINPLL